jgi:regulator of RNase E activity RraA
VFADSSGAVLIPDGQIDEVLAEARKIEATDAASPTRWPASRFA